MTTWVIVGQFTIGLGVLGYLLWPMLTFMAGDDRYSDRPESSGEELPESFVQVMSDLEYDFETGKLSRDDYERLRETIFREANPDVTVEDSSDERSESDERDQFEDAVEKARDQLDM